MPGAGGSQLGGFPWGQLSSSLATSITAVYTRQGQAKGRWETQREGLVYLREKGVPEAAPKGRHSRFTTPHPHPTQPGLPELIWTSPLLDVILVSLLTLSSMIFWTQLWSCLAVITSVDRRLALLAGVCAVTTPTPPPGSSLLQGDGPYSVDVL